MDLLLQVNIVHMFLLGLIFLLLSFAALSISVRVKNTGHNSAEAAGAVKSSMIATITFSALSVILIVFAFIAIIHSNV